MKARKWDIVADTIIDGHRVEKHIEFFTGTYKEMCKRADEIDKEHFSDPKTADLYESVEAYLLEDGERVNDFAKISRVGKSKA